MASRVRHGRRDVLPVASAAVRQVSDAALAQCRERNYAARFVGENLPVYYVGVNYNPAADVRTIDDVKCERAE